MKSSGNVHYLKNIQKGPVASSPSSATPPSYEDLIQRIENRLDKIEREFQEKVQTLERHKEKREGITRSELSSLIRNLEATVQTVSEEIRGGRALRDNPQMKVAWEILKRVRGLLSLEAFKDFLISLWYGSQE